MTEMFPVAQPALSGGSADLAPLWAELAHWPGWSVSSIVPSCTWGGRDPDGAYVPDRGSYTTWNPTSWCVTAEAGGWEPRGRRFRWGQSIAVAAGLLAEEMEAVRLNPHLDHICAYGYHEAYFEEGCADCDEDKEMLGLDEDD
jgi:hypothetical protein